MCEPLQQVFARWDGKGVPGDVGGEDDRAADAAVPPGRHRRGPPPRHAASTPPSRSRRAERGKHFDPAVVDAFCAVAGDVLGDTGRRARLARARSTPSRPCSARLTDDELDGALEAIADFTDLRSPSRAGHSRAVAELAALAAAERGLPDADVTAVRRAGLVHDIGLHGIPATILDKPGPLSAAESERMRMHPYYTERMLGPTRPRSPASAPSRR